MSNEWLGQYVRLVDELNAAGLRVELHLTTNRARLDVRDIHGELLASSGIRMSLGTATRMLHEALSSHPDIVLRALGQRAG